MALLSGERSSISDLCSQYQISQTQYYKWRDKFLENGFQTFELRSDKEKERLKQKVQKLNGIIGQLTVELKKKRGRLLRKKSLCVEKRNQELIEKIRHIKSEHPFWGYRRIWASLYYGHKLSVNKKRILRLMKENRLLVSQMRKLKAKRTPLRPKPRASRPNELWGTDMTKVMIPSFGWIYLTIVLDWHTKKIAGYSVNIQSKTQDWLDALNMAVKEQFPKGIREYGQVSLVSDNGSQPTSQAFMKECSIMGIKQIFASYNNPKGNADTERMMRTIKEELVWINEFSTIAEFKEKFENWVMFYNNEYLHSSLNYRSPNNFENMYFSLNNDKTTLPLSFSL